jgi:hypothetical protein
LLEPESLVALLFFPGVSPFLDGIFGNSIFVYVEFIILDYSTMSSTPALMPSAPRSFEKWPPT